MRDIVYTVFDIIIYFVQGLLLVTCVAGVFCLKKADSKSFTM